VGRGLREREGMAQGVDPEFKPQYHKKRKKKKGGAGVLRSTPSTANPPPKSNKNPNFM
jgi:hypothetical protein